MSRTGRRKKNETQEEFPHNILNSLFLSASKLEIKHSFPIEYHVAINDFLLALCDKMLETQFHVITDNDEQQVRCSINFLSFV